MKRAIYPGSFDPITHGHLDVAERALRLFDELVIAVALNEGKKPLFSLEERTAMVSESVRSLPGHERIRVTSFDNLLVDYADQQDAIAVVRGLRALSDFEYEFQLALLNRRLNARVETIFLMPRGTYMAISSRMIKEIAKLGGKVDAFVPEGVKAALSQKFHSP
ncbi:MAG: pantetheine-phosphate adenylyltransferase [Candidatus Methylacidiphilales bacterium]|nr:pantetheine-phosphate adenylyltransferase [Candidatus Methylacidiphilales bacterium]